jgi:hypothetical protein
MWFKFIKYLPGGGGVGRKVDTRKFQYTQKSAGGYTPVTEAGSTSYPTLYNCLMYKIVSLLSDWDQGVGGKGPHSYNNFFSIYEVCTRQCLPKMP